MRSMRCARASRISRGAERRTSGRRPHGRRRFEDRRLRRSWCVSTNRSVRPGRAVRQPAVGTPQHPAGVSSSGTKLRRAGSARAAPAPARQTAIALPWMNPTQSASRSTSSMSCDEIRTVHGRSPDTSSRPRIGFVADERIEAGERLVEDHEVGAVHERRPAAPPSCGCRATTCSSGAARRQTRGPTRASPAARCPSSGRTGGSSRNSWPGVMHTGRRWFSET